MPAGGIGLWTVGAGAFVVVPVGTQVVPRADALTDFVLALAAAALRGREFCWLSGL